MNTKIIAIALILIVALPIGAGYVLNITDVEHTEYTVKESRNVTDSLLNGTVDSYTYDNSYLNNVMSLNTTGVLNKLNYAAAATSTISSIPANAQTVGPTTYTATSSYQALDLSGVTYIYGKIYNDLTVKFVYVDGTSDEVTIAAGSAGINCSYMYNVASYITGYTTNVKDNVVGIQYKTASTGSMELYTQKYATATTYFDYTKGWSINTLLTYWLNGKENGEVLITFKVPTTNYTTDYTFYSEGNNTVNAVNNVTITRTAAGVLSVGSETLGKYDYVRILMTTENTQVYGVVGSDWPAVDEVIKPVKTITVANANVDKISRVYMPQYEKVRIDHTAIVSGSYPAIKDNTYDPTALYPGITDYQITLSKIDTFGSSISIGGTSYTVTDGQITVGTKKVDLDGAVIKSVKNGTVWNNSINDKQLANTSSIATVYFAGAWSAIVVHDTLQQTTYTTQEWVPGHYGLDNTDACLVGLLGCLAVFIGLGLYGKHTGAKVWPLMIVCGSMALIFLCMI